jgi:hypothetical protein
MRKHVCVAFFVLLFSSSVNAQELIENPEQPKNPDEGRILNLVEVLRISDDSGEFFFKYPRELKVAEDGTIFYYDREQVVRLDEQGNFLFNYFKKGQGPGELNMVRGFELAGDRLVVFNAMPNKLVWFKFDGELIQDKKIKDVPGFLKMAFTHEGMFYFFKYGIPNTEDKIEIVETPEILMAIDNEGYLNQEIASFPIKVFAKGTDRGGAMVSLSSLYSAPFQAKFLCISHTSDYLVKVYDIKSQSLVRSFNRNYQRIKPPKDWVGGGIGTLGGKTHRPPRPDFLNDINGLYVFQDLLWVLTSTKDEEKGMLIDAFNIEGEFVDSFYLDISGSVIGTHQDCIFVLSRTEDDLWNIVKYRVVGLPGITKQRMFASTAGINL